MPLNSAPVGQWRRHRVVSQDLGRLARLPMELIYETLRYLDLESLVRFRCLNSTAAETVDSLREYRLIRTHAPTALEAHPKSQACRICDGFGGFLYLLDCTRCCFESMRYAPALWVTTPPLAELRFAVPTGEILTSALPTLQTLPGRYGLEQAPDDGGSYFSPRSIHPRVPETGDQDFQVSPADLRQLARDRREWGGSANNNGFDPWSPLPFPHLDSAIRTGWQAWDFLQGLSYICEPACRTSKGCPLGLARPDDDDVIWVFSEEDFVRHCVDCKPAQKLWSSIQRGPTEPISPRLVKAALSPTFL
ncbi:MAG: hypothetical protein M1816_001280 [Peltula sp. TS41687]|nr:MAG: hypothetical protein M1816_001280 [Peltula sp. TS41687]